MKKLPFLTPPREAQMRRCGNAASGVLELPVLGGLTVGEAALTTHLIGDQESAFVVAARASEAIAKEEQISLSEAFTIIDNALRGVELEDTAEAIRLKYAPLVEQVGKTFAISNQRTMRAQVTALIACRLNQPDWSLEDTDGLHRALFSDLLQLVEDELAAEENEPPAPADDESLGKPPEASTNERKRTGRRSAGNS